MNKNNPGKFVLHAGPHKTATTYLQLNFYKDRGALKKGGWLYPTDFGIQDGHPNAHHDAAHDADAYLGAEGTKRTDVTKLARKLQRRGENLLLSAEGFSVWSRRQYELLADRLGYDVIDVVYAVRDPVKMFASHWGEEIKQGSTSSMTERLSRHLADPMASRVMNPLVDLRPLINSDRVRVHAIPFELLKAQKIDIYQHFCDKILGLPGMEPRQSSPKNTAFPIELTEFLRMLTLMQSGGERRVGSAFRLDFIAKTTPAERAEFVRLIKAEALNARRVLKIPADASYRKRLEAMVKTALEPYWTLPVGDAPIFDQEDQRLVYFNEFSLWNNEQVHSAAQDVLTKMGY